MLTLFFSLVSRFSAKNLLHKKDCFLVFFGLKIVFWIKDCFLD